MDLEPRASSARTPMTHNSSAVKKAVAADPKAVGYILSSDVDSTVKVILTLN
jgi:hypothetical protein